MPRGILTAAQRETAQVLTEVPGAEGRLGPRPSTWVANAPVPVGVQPLGAEEQTRMGLTADRELLRVQLPRGQVVHPGGRLRLRGSDWRVVRVEPWQSYTLAICEEVA